MISRCSFIGQFIELGEFDVLGGYLDDTPVPPDNQRDIQLAVSQHHSPVSGSNGSVDGVPIQQDSSRVSPLQNHVASPICL